MGTPVTLFIVIPPLLNIPNKTAANKAPIGFNPPIKATAKPSQPYPGEKPSMKRLWTPNTSPAPPRPANAPLTTKAIINPLLTLIPPFSAANGFNPIALTS